MVLPEPTGDLPTIPIERIALFLDVDGTLIDIAPTPDSVVVSPALKDLLRTLLERLGGALALVSGRAIADLDRLFDPLRLPAAGQHGAEWRLSAEAPIERAGRLPKALRDAAVALAERHPGMLAEDKGGAIALHVRARPELTGEIGAALREMVQAHPEFEVLHGKAVFEVRRRGVHKGAAVERLTGHAPFSGRTPIFIGDDTTDLDAIALVASKGGHGLLVGPDGPLHSPHEVRSWLGTLIDASAS